MAGKVLLAASLCALVVGLCALGSRGSRNVEADALSGAADSLPSEVLPPPAPAPALFSRMSYAQARGAARGSGRFLIVEGVVTWSGSCKIMDETTWSDPRVVGWIRQRAVAVEHEVGHIQSLWRDIIHCLAFVRLELDSRPG